MNPAPGTGPAPPKLTSTEQELLDGRPWTTGACLLCGATQLPVTPIVTVYPPGPPAALAKCRACMAAGLITQRATAAALQRPYSPALPPIPEGHLMPPAAAIPATTARPATQPTNRPAPPSGNRTAPHRLGVLGLVWILGNSAALSLLWAQVTTTQHNNTPTAASTPDVTPNAA
ncbi:hypothetical protein OIE69_00510 [Actinacidiphila glaucinigra]|uniref:hypothetical protein n=1 Tax=Actinacidiphila glaucinigra TaxID=235986 RepID=UPI002DD89C8C|nr:hypothetical protein [Actinacidiphila glaucinigra]WSD57539.1 hypothetical protein OIE69_00510 [Actinacidiphila glaucinigra]